MTDMHESTQNLFGCPIAFYKLKRKFTQEEIKFIKNLKTIEGSGNNISQVKQVLELDQLSVIKFLAEKCIDDYLHRIYVPKDKVRLTITQSWCNYTEAGNFHHKHKHSNSFVSGVLYIQTEKNRDKIYFYNDIYKPLKIVPKQYNEWNSDFWWFNVNEGDLLLFPSSMSHGVEKIEEGKTRISLAFNCYPTGIIGENYAKLNLKHERLD